MPIFQVIMMVVRGLPGTLTRGTNLPRLQAVVVLGMGMMRVRLGLSQETASLPLGGRPEITRVAGTHGRVRPVDIEELPQRL